MVVTLITNAVERVAPGATLWGGGRDLVVQASAAHQHRWRVRFDGVATRDEADALAGTTLYAAPIDDPDALWFHDLIGAVAVLADGTVVGEVEAIQDNPASDLLVLSTGALVPMVFVGDLVDGKVQIDPPDGLLELYAD